MLGLKLNHVSKEGPDVGTVREANFEQEGILCEFVDSWGHYHFMTNSTPFREPFY